MISKCIKNKILFVDFCSIFSFPEKKKESVTLTQNRLVCYSMKSYQEYSGRVVSVLDEPLERRERSDCKHPMLIPIDYWCLNIYVNKLRVVSCWRRPMPHDCLFPDFTKIVPWSEMTNSFEWLCGTCCDDKTKDTFLLLSSFLPSYRSIHLSIMSQ